MKLLVISNGHGEDSIAVKIIRQLKQLLPDLKIAGLPMVGKGFAYAQENIDIVTRLNLCLLVALSTWTIRNYGRIYVMVY